MKGEADFRERMRWHVKENFSGLNEEQRKTLADYLGALGADALRKGIAQWEDVERDGIRWYAHVSVEGALQSLVVETPGADREAD